ncbi:flagellar motor protein MotA [Caldimicrobium thiodismutans]|jgi:biopolymer transport protein ExbB/TolQ|uniref:Flagellar motor protein MotA n=1 Tax=Caldimicrobium thiodismutans TaxID=1653476 RepID=A0A0U5BWI4_9BACT|nr:MotA/TolQ/ExbB proton channel family protein [Caldimicrobium thiodismutans]BAU22997.1 flagellar motor protein MotA [Caldimicrobium thiodismutans]
MTNPFYLLEGFLFILAESLLYPVLLTLTFLIFYLVYQSGKILREYFERREGRNFYVEFFEAELKKLEEKFQGEALLIEVSLLVDRVELSLLKGLDRVRVMVRLGPALGLLGTLIPMGVALSELAKGNLGVMAERMVTAFTTAIIGLSIGALSYLLSITKERWNKETLSKIYYLAERERIKISSSEVER